MKISVNNQKNLLGKKAQTAAKARIRSAFSKFGRKIVSVQLSTDAVNGPRGGVDKRVRILVKMNRLDDVVATVDDDSLSRALSFAVQRAERAVDRRVQRAARSVARSRAGQPLGLV